MFDNSIDTIGRKNPKIFIHMIIAIEAIEATLQLTRNGILGPTTYETLMWLFRKKILESAAGHKNLCLVIFFPLLYLSSLFMHLILLTSFLTEKV